MTPGTSTTGEAERLTQLRARFGFAKFAYDGRTHGTDSRRMVAVVADASRRLTSVEVQTSGTGQPVEALAHAVDEAVVAAEAARSLQSYAIATEQGLVAPPSRARRRLSHPGPSAREAAMALPVESVTPDRPRRPGGSPVFEALGIGHEESARGPRVSDGPFVGGDPERGVRVTLRADGWTSTLRLEPWLRSADPKALSRAVLDAYQDAYHQVDTVGHEGEEGTS